MDFALEVAIAILVIGGHMIAAISFRIRYGAAMKCEICNVFLNGQEQFDRHLRGGTHYKGLKKRKRQAERDVQSYEILMNDILRKKREGARTRTCLALLSHCVSHQARAPVV